MIRTCAVIALFMARMTVAVFDLGKMEPPAGLDANPPAAIEPVEQLQATVVSGLPQDAGTLWR